MFPRRQESYSLRLSYQHCAYEINRNTVFLLQIGTALADKPMDSDENYVRCALGTAEERLCVYILRNSPHETFHIEGGNHAQFGNYGRQKGDSGATISREDQQAQAVSAITKYIGQNK